MFANIYLNEIDSYAKHVLKSRYYYRFMDDTVIVLKDKQKAKEVLFKITEFLRDKLKLELNSKTNIFKISQGVNFCGYKITMGRMRLRDKGKKNLIKKLKYISYALKNKKMTVSEARVKLSGHVGYMCHADVKGLINKYFYIEK